MQHTLTLLSCLDASDARRCAILQHSRAGMNNTHFSLYVLVHVWHRTRFIMSRVEETEPS